MKYPNSLFLIIFSLLTTMTRAQDPCTAICCPDGNEEDFESFTLGNLPNAPSGWYDEYGQALLVNNGCGDSQRSISIEGPSMIGSGGAPGFRINGVTGPTPIFTEGQNYCVSLCYRFEEDGTATSGDLDIRAVNSTQTGPLCTGSCELIGTTPSISSSSGWRNYQTFYTPTSTYDQVIFSHDNVGSLDEIPNILIDNVCITPITDDNSSCQADFTYAIMDCGEVCFISDLCGEFDSFLWTITGLGLPSSGSTSSNLNFCFIFPQNGSFIIELEVFCSDGLRHKKTEVISVTNVLMALPTVTCPSDQTETGTVVNGACTFNYIIPSISFSNGTLVCTFDGAVVQVGDVRSLTQGMHTLSCTVFGSCNSRDDCSTTISIDCENEEPTDTICGRVAITCFPGSRAILGTSPIDMTKPVYGIVDVRDRSGVPFGLWVGAGGSNIYHPSHWNATNLGLVFGIAIDATDNVYLTATTIYGCDSPTFPAFGPGGGSGIYKIDRSDIITQVITTGPYVVSGSTIPNNGGGLGNICYNAVHDMLYVTNLSDGYIYQINGSGSIVDRFDPFVPTPTSSNAFAPLGDRPWGIAYNSLDNKLYYANWLEDRGRTNSTQNNEIWSVGLDASGFVLPATESMIISLPDLTNGDGNPVSDIAISVRGNLLLAERTKDDDCGYRAAHASRVLEYHYNKISLMWELTPGHTTPITSLTDLKFGIGGSSGQNSAGGVDYGYDSFSGLSPRICDQFVWASADYMVDCVTGGRYYGIQGLSASGGINCNSYEIDFSGSSGVNTWNKFGQGDVEIFRCSCFVTDLDCDSLMVMSHSKPNVCMDPTIITGNPCGAVFDPVCGCDGMTYSNSCVATEAGITTYVAGSCTGENTPPVDEKCCYYIDLKNNWGPDIVELETEVLGAEWIFNTVSLSPPFVFGSCGSFNSKFCIKETSGGSIPFGTTLNALSFCFSPLVTSPSSNPKVVFRWKQLFNGQDLVTVCTDTLDYECDIQPPDSCLTIIDKFITCHEDNDPLHFEYCLTIQNNSGQDVGQITLECLDPGFFFYPSFTTSQIIIPTPNPFPNNTTQQICFDVATNIPIVTSRQLCLKLGLISTARDKCCHDPVEICTLLEPCCDPCEDNGIIANVISGSQDECCYSIGLINNCSQPYFTKIEAEVITPGVCFGSHVINPIYISSWNVVSSPTTICMTPAGGLTLPSYPDLFDFCLDKIDDSSKSNPKILFKWYANDPFTGKPTVLCTDSLMTECEPPDSNVCLVVTDQQLVCLPDSSKYRYTFTITNLSNPAFTADRLILQVKNDPSNYVPFPTGPIIPLVPTLPFGQSRTISTCIKGIPFPPSYADFVFSYRLQYSGSGDCCFESQCDTIPIPPCDSMCTKSPDCITILDIDETSVLCDTSGCYSEPFCLTWLRSLLIDSDANGCRLLFDYSSFKRAYYNGQVVFVGFKSGAPDGGSQDVYTCDGTLLQSCTQGIGVVCGPDAGIDIGADLTSVNTFWNCGDVIPPLDPLCGVGKMTVNYCMTITNNTSTPITQIDLSLLLGQSVIINPSVFTFSPLGVGMSRQICFDVTGSQSPGDTVKLTSTVSDPTNPLTECCMDTDTLCLEVPPCPDEELCPSVDTMMCCLDFSGFTAIDTFGLTSPTVGNGDGEDYIDIDNDGDFDYTFWRSGGLYYFENIGSSTVPNFNSTAILFLPNEFAVYGHDYNNDGFTDIFSLDITTREVLYHENQRLSGIGFNTVGLGIIIPSTGSTSIAIGDISNDGIEDLLVHIGNLGNLHIIYYEGACTNPTAPCYTLVANSYSSPLIDVPGAQVTSFNQIELEDGDCDGDLDIFMADGNFSSASLTGVTWYLENYGTVVPSGTAPDIERTTHSADPFGLVGWFPAFEEATIRFADIDADGKQEAFINTGFGGEVYFYESCEDTIVRDCCCMNFDSFCDLVDQGFQITMNGCEGIVDAPQFDSCHWFGTSMPDWDDGTITLPVITPAKGAGPWTHTYSSPGKYTICIDVFEGSDVDNLCWNKQMCTTVDISCCDVLDCSLVDISITQDPMFTDSCCFIGAIENNYCDNYFKGIKVVSNAATISQMSALSGWFINQLSALEAELYPFTTIALGSQDIFQICHENLSGSFSVTVTWLVDDGNGGCIEECMDEIELECIVIPPDSPSRCLQVLEDSLNCETNTYCIKVKNTTSPSFELGSLDINILSPSGASVSPNPLSLNPPLQSGQTSDWLCFNYANVIPGDGLCFNIVGHKEDITTNLRVTQCCADTVDHCIRIPINCGGGSGGMCCYSFPEFLNLIDLGYQMSIDGCTISVDATQFDSCHWFGTSMPDWGDGTINPPVITSAVNAGPWIHTYASSGTYTICLDVFEGPDVDNFCWNEQMCIDVTVGCTIPPDACDKINLVVPNGLTPNGDGFNDEFKIGRPVGCEVDISVYNRWGQLVWEQANYDDTWGGESTNGKILPDGTYYVIMALKGASDDGQAFETFIDIRTE